MNNARIDPAKYMKLNMVDRIKAMAYRIESGVIVTGDKLNDDDVPVLEFIGSPSRIVHDGAQLLRLLNNKLVYLNNND